MSRTRDILALAVSSFARVRIFSSSNSARCASRCPVGCSRYSGILHPIIVTTIADNITNRSQFFTKFLKNNSLATIELRLHGTQILPLLRRLIFRANASDTIQFSIDPRPRNFLDARTLGTNVSLAALVEFSNRARSVTHRSKTVTRTDLLRTCNQYSTRDKPARRSCTRNSLLQTRAPLGLPVPRKILSELLPFAISLDNP